MKSCCDRHADILPHGCNQGRLCPERNLGGGTYYPREIAEPIPSAERVAAWLPYAGIVIAIGGVVVAFLLVALAASI
jgi:hypothetical protein